MWNTRRGAARFNAQTAGIFGELRKSIVSATSKHLKSEIDKDVTNIPLAKPGSRLGDLVAL